MSFMRSCRSLRSAASARTLWRSSRRAPICSPRESTAASSPDTAIICVCRAASRSLRTDSFSCRNDRYILCQCLHLLHLALYQTVCVFSLFDRVLVLLGKLAHRKGSRYDTPAVAFHCNTTYFSSEHLIYFTEHAILHYNIKTIWERRLLYERR